MSTDTPSPSDEVVAIVPAAAGDEEDNDEQLMAAMLDLSKKKKKTKKKVVSAAVEEMDHKPVASNGNEAVFASTAVDPHSSNVMQQQQQQQSLRLQALDAAQELHLDNDQKASWTYEALLERVMDLLHKHHPDLVEKKRTRIKPPHLQLLSSKKTLWVNFQEICSMMQREPNHVYAFFMAELGTEGSIDGNQRLIIRGKYVSKYIESLLRKYVIEYVTCEMCRSPHTTLVKDAASRLYFCQCQDCGSSRSVAPIRSGYHATSRADRRAARNAKN